MARSKFFITALVLLLTSAGIMSDVRAQIVQGLQLSAQPLASGSRGLAMGGNLISAADGVDALDYNPAAIAPIASHEFTISLFNRDHASTALFNPGLSAPDNFGAYSSSSLNAMSLSSLGLAAPFATDQGHFAMGVSFDRVRDYTSSYSFKGVNPNSSYLNTQGFITGNGATPLSGYGTGINEYLANYNLAYALGLTYGVPDTGSYMLTTPFKGGLEQSGTVTTEGGLNAVRIGAGIDIAEGISAGATVNILFGTYDYTMNYQEKDVNGIFANDTGSLPPNRFQQANLTTTLHQDQSGGSLKLGLLVDKQIVKFGVTLETPEAMHINETSQQTGTAQFGGNIGTYTSDNASQLPIYVDDYDIVTPMRIGAGASIHLLGLVGSASISYADMSQLRFSNASVDMTGENNFARDSLRGVLSWQLGAEYTFLGISVRAGYSSEPSPYKGDPTNYGVSAISGGLGFALSKSIVLEAALRHAMYHTSHAVYNDLTPQGAPVSANVTDDAVTRDDVSVTFSYRY